MTTSTALTPKNESPRFAKASRLVGTLVCGLLLAAAGGCSRSPVAPTEEQRMLEVSPELQPAYEMLVNTGASASWAGESIGSWAARPRQSVTRIALGDLPTGIQAQFNGAGGIILSRGLVDQPREVIAGFIAHELRHADGIEHACADRQRDRSADAGAWSVQVSVLRSYGLNQAADVIRAHKFCEGN